MPKLCTAKGPGHLEGAWVRGREGTWKGKRNGEEECHITSLTRHNDVTNAKI